MIELILRIVLAIATGSGCQIGKPADYYAWVDAHPDYKVQLTLSTQMEGDWWLMVAGDENLLFKFAEPLEDTIPTGASHGECARMVQ